LKPIIVIAIMAIAGITLSTGFLGNEIELWIQQFGVGSGDIQTPIDHVTVDFFINQITDQFDHFKNLVQACELTLDEEIGQQIGTLLDPADTNTEVTKDSELTCKITDENGDIIAEGTISTADVPTPVPGVFPPDTYSVPVLKDPNDPTSWPFVGEVHDVIVVVHANTYNTGDFVNP
jgi:hypothetical protein